MFLWPASTNYASTQHQLVIPRPGTNRCCDDRILHRLPATTGVPWQGQILAILRPLLGGGMYPLPRTEYGPSFLLWGPSLTYSYYPPSVFTPSSTASALPLLISISRYYLPPPFPPTLAARPLLWGFTPPPLPPPPPRPSGLIRITRDWPLCGHPPCCSP